MRRMFSEKQIKELANELLASGDVNVINGDNINADNIDANELSVSGDANVFENIVDKDGHKRFIEGDIEFSELDEGVSFPYAKWSLSGSHLMIVVCINALTGSSTQIRSVYLNTLPQWVIDKIVPVFGVFIDSRPNLTMSASDASTGGTITTNIAKSDGKIRFGYYIASPTTKDCYIRIAYDLLIDNE